MTRIKDSRTEKLNYITTPDQKQQIKEGQKQINRGESIPNAQVEAEIDKWLNEIGLI